MNLVRALRRFDSTLCRDRHYTYADIYKNPQHLTQGQYKSICKNVGFQELFESILVKGERYFFLIKFVMNFVNWFYSQHHNKFVTGGDILQWLVDGFGVHYFRALKKMVVKGCVDEKDNPFFEKEILTSNKMTKEEFSSRFLSGGEFTVEYAPLIVADVSVVVKPSDRVYEATIIHKSDALFMVVYTTVYVSQPFLHWCEIKTEVSMAEVVEDLFKSFIEVKIRKYYGLPVDLGDAFLMGVRLLEQLHGAKGGFDMHDPSTRSWFMSEKPEKWDKYKIRDYCEEHMKLAEYYRTLVSKYDIKVDTFLPCFQSLELDPGVINDENRRSAIRYVWKYEIRRFWSFIDRMDISKIFVGDPHDFRPFNMRYEYVNLRKLLVAYVTEKGFEPGPDLLIKTNKLLGYLVFEDKLANIRQVNYHPKTLQKLVSEFLVQGVYDSEVEINPFVILKCVKECYPERWGFFQDDVYTILDLGTVDRYTDVLSTLEPEHLQEFKNHLVPGIFKGERFPLRLFQILRLGFFEQLGWLPMEFVFHYALVNILILSPLRKL